MTYYFTSINCGYIARAMVLASSLKKHNSNLKFGILLCDQRPDNLQTSADYFDFIVTLEELGLPVDNVPLWIFKHTIRELCTAPKGYMVKYLFNHYKAEKVIYLDPDIAVFNSMKHVEDLLDTYDAVLIPHISRPAKAEDCLSVEVPLLNAGLYNLGFIAIKDSENGKEIIEFWCNRLLAYCYDDYARHNMDRSLYADQKWCSLLPVIFDNIFILKNPEYNVARWNYHEREISGNIEKGFLINGNSLVFFHFSYWETAAHEGIYSDMNDWYTLQGKEDKCLKELSDWYATENQKTISIVPMPADYKFCYNFFNNNEKITDEYRYRIREDVYVFEKFKHSNPFDARDLNSYYHWCQENYKSKEDDVTTKVSCNSNTLNQMQSNLFLRILRKFYTRIKLPAHIKKRSKDIFFKITAPFFKNTGIYQQWLHANSFLQQQPEQITHQNTQVKFVSTNNLCSGINITGFLKGEFGTAHSARLMLKAALAAHIPVSAINSIISIPHSCNDSTYDSIFETSFKRKATLWCYNADMVSVTRNFISEENWGGRYNIGLWFWEAPDFPDEWIPSFDYLDEIWVSSQFTLESIKKKSPIPVYLVPLPTEIDESRIVKCRKDFKLPENAFLFLTMYDVYSVNERKNPKAAVAAFLQAFKKNDSNVGLVIKINNPDSNFDEVYELEKLLKDYKNIYIVAETLPQYDVYALINCCDVLISLHRAEGFGLALTEAMYLGKPVVATNWSANVDFMTTENSCPVDYKLVQLDKDYGPYKQHQFWADAEIQHASEYLVKLFNDPQYYSLLSKQAKDKICNEYSSVVVGCIIRDRLKQLGLL